MQAGDWIKLFSLFFILISLVNFAWAKDPYSFRCYTEEGELLEVSRDSLRWGDHLVLDYATDRREDSQARYVFFVKKEFSLTAFQNQIGAYVFQGFVMVTNEAKRRAVYTVLCDSDERLFHRNWASLGNWLKQQYSLLAQ